MFIERQKTCSKEVMDILIAKEWHAPDTCCDRCAEAAGTPLKGLENLSTSIERRRHFLQNPLKTPNKRFGELESLLQLPSWNKQSGGLQENAGNGRGFLLNYRVYNQHPKPFLWYKVPYSFQRVRLFLCTFAVQLTSSVQLLTPTLLQHALIAASYP